MTCEQNWIPLVWKCKSCNNGFYPEISSKNYLNLQEIMHLFNTSDEHEIEQAYYEKMGFILVGEFSGKCRKCQNDIHYKSIIELGEYNKEKKEFKKIRDILVGSDDLKFVQSGFIFRGVDIHEVLPIVLLKWWIEYKDIYVVNPFITIKGMKLLGSIGHYIENYSYSISKIKPNHNPFKKVIMQKNQNYGKDSPISIIKKAENTLLDEKNEILSICKSTGFRCIRDNMYITTPLPDNKKSKESHIRNSGKFHAKFYAGVSTINSELITTSFNLIESEYLQMETFNYMNEYSSYIINSELNKIIDDKFMKIEREIT